MVTDYDLDKNPIGTQPIGEFPAFSFILGDNHPHVLALPFVVMAIGMMLNLTLNRRRPANDEILLYGLAAGGLTFLNAWDGPIYLCGFVGAEALRRLMTSEAGKLTAGDWIGLVRFGASLAAIAFLAYLPYFVGFRSQAGGLLPNLLHPTQFRRFLHHVRTIDRACRLLSAGRDLAGKVRWPAELAAGSPRRRRAIARIGGI